MIHRALLLTLLVPTIALARTPTSQPSPDLVERAWIIQGKTSRLRGLASRRRVKIGVMSRAQILEYVEKKLSEQYTPAEIEAEAAVLKALGLLPATLDYRTTVLAMLKEQVAGFYDPPSRTLNLADWIPITLQEPALSHELCHALQDQHFNLKRLTRPNKDNSDQQLALAAVIEGDCTGVMLEYMLLGQGVDLGTMPDGMARLARQSMVGQGSDVVRNAPAFLRETMFFPYLHGLELMQQIRSRHPWSQVNALYRRTPDSTEQILHPGKYWRRERPVVIRAGRRLPALDGHRLLKEDVLGEFQLAQLLELGVSRELAQRAAAGWGGDRLAAYTANRPGDPLLIHLSSWDSDADALEYVNALRFVLARRGFKPASEPAEVGVWVYADAADRRWSVQLEERHVLMLGLVPKAIWPSLQQQVWQQWRIGGRRVRPARPPTR